MHESVMAFVSQCITKYHIIDKTVLDVGSMDINGTARPLFVNSRYVGVDMLAGKNVDIIMNSNDLKFPDASYDVVLSLECLEHDEEFWSSLREIGRVLKPGGFMLLTTRGLGFPYHPYPKDCWRFTKDAALPICKLAGIALLECLEDPQASGIFIVGQRGS